MSAPRVRRSGGAVALSPRSRASRVRPVAFRELAGENLHNRAAAELRERAPERVGNRELDRAGGGSRAGTS